jgi:hypothetical protein
MLSAYSKRPVINCLVNRIVVEEGRLRIKGVIPLETIPEGVPLGRSVSLPS